MPVLHSRSRGCPFHLVVFIVSSVHEDLGRALPHHAHCFLDVLDCDAPGAEDAEVPVGMEAVDDGAFETDVAWAAVEDNL